MTVNTLFVIVLIMFIISLIGDIVLAHRFNNHTKDYDELLTKVNNIDEWCDDQDDSIALLKTDSEALKTSINTLQNQVSNLSKPEQATKEQILQVLDEQNVLTSSIKDGAVILEEK